MWLVVHEQNDGNNGAIILLSVRADVDDEVLLNDRLTLLHQTYTQDLMSVYSYKSSQSWSVKKNQKQKQDFFLLSL